VNVAVVAPAGTVTAPGTEAVAELSLESAIAAPPAGAGAVSITVPVETLPPVTRGGFRLIADRVITGLTVSATDLVTPP
jgi:hypothetical protein